jgi:hypothetical protein
MSREKKRNETKRKLVSAAPTKPLLKQAKQLTYKSTAMLLLLLPVHRHTPYHLYILLIIYLYIYNLHILYQYINIYIHSAM